MYGLIKNELVKIFKRPGTYVMLGLLILIISGIGFLFTFQFQRGVVPDNSEWKYGLQLEINHLEQQKEQLLETAPNADVEYYEKQIAINQYRIDNGISPNVDYSVWDFVSDAAMVIDFAGMFAIIIAAGIVANEYKWGTIKLLLIRPMKRWKILLSKYATVLIFAFLMVSISFLYSAILGYILFGSPDGPYPYLYYKNGVVVEQSMGLHLWNWYGLSSIKMLIMATMAFMISAVFRSSSLAIGLSIFLMLTGTQFTYLIAMKYDWAKYILFANTDLIQYFEGRPMLEGMTLSFSVGMLIVYFLLFMVLAFFVFNKRDVAA